MRSVQDRVIVITGASSGIGRAAALKFAKDRAKLVLAARRRNLLRDLESECERRGAEAISVETDVSNARSVMRLCRKALAEFGRIDVWINDAGVATYGRFDEVPVEEHRKVVETNLLGTLYGSREAIREFRQRGEGILINMASFLGKGSSPYHGSYVASKHGIRGLDMSIRQELWADGDKDIHVCTVMPVAIDTPFFQHAANHLGREMTPIPPVYRVENVANAIYELALKPRDEITVGRAGRVAGLQHRLAPRLFERQMARHIHRSALEKRRHARETSGSLFRPMKEGSGIRGGWLEDEHAGGILEEASNGVGSNRRARKIAGGIAALAAPAVLGWLAFRQRQTPTEEQFPVQAA